MKISVVIAVYKNIDFLSVVLESIARQRFTDFEVIIAEDDDDPVMKRFVDEQSRRRGFPLKHVFQAHRGFGKNRILNAALLIAQGEYVTFLDGDCVLHRHYLNEYMKRAHTSLCLFGRRVILDKTLTGKLIATKNLKYLSWWRILFSRSGRREDAFLVPFPTSRKTSGIYGSSFFIARENMAAINGFDEDFTHPYFGEDTDVERRLKLIGIRFKCTRQKTIQYHLYHERGDDAANWQLSATLYRQKEKEGLSYCINGLVKGSIHPPASVRPA